MTRRDRISLVASIAIPLASLSTLLMHPARVVGQSSPSRAHRSMPMTDAAMRQRAEQWWANHRPVGASAGGVTDLTITVRDFQFDADNNLATVVDTARIFVGETVTWQWINGFHTVTNGTDSGDPNAGTIFDAPMDNTHTTFSYTFNSVGTFPYFCIVHEGTMVGWVVVRSLTGVDPGPLARPGFSRDPSPNPTTRGASFAFVLREAGPVRAEVFDARGRRIAVPIDAELGAGAHPGSWDGRRADGRNADAGVYYLRLRLPGYSGTRTVTVAR